MKLGVFLCTCDKTVSTDFKAVKKALKGKAEIIRVHDRLCRDEGLAYLVDDTRRKELEGVIIGCTCKNKIFENVLSELGVPSEDIHTLNLREHCGWIHEKKEATEKARAMVSFAIARIKDIPKLHPLVIEVGYDVLVVGSNKVGAEAAKRLNALANTYLLTNGSEEEGSNLPEELPHYVGTVEEVDGSIGNFSVTISKNPIDPEKCILCGKCVSPCPKEAIVYNNGRYLLTGECDSCGACVEKCPTGAIDLSEEKTEVLKVGQILVLEPDWNHMIRRGIVVGNTGPASATAVLEVVTNLDEIKVPKYLEVDIGNCAGGKGGFEGCNICLTSCPHGAITRNGDAVIFDPASCNGCGTCAAICPISIPDTQRAPKGTLFSQMEGLLKTDLKPTVLLFASEDCKALLEEVGRKGLSYPPAIPMFLPSAPMASEEHILRALDLGADGVILLGALGEKGLKKVEQNVNFSNEISKALGLGDRALFIEAESEDLSGLVAKIGDFINKLEPNPVRDKEPATLEKLENREVFLTLVSALSKKTGTDPKLIFAGDKYPFAEVSISSSCTGCDTCTNMCPTGAIEKKEAEITFDYSRCMACGLCAASCPEKAIELKGVFDLGKLIKSERTALHKLELVKCKNCGKAFITKEALQKVMGMMGDNPLFDLEEQKGLLSEYCEDCRATIAVQMRMDKLDKEVLGQ